MKTTIFKIGLMLLYLVFLGVACEEDEQLPPNQAKGKIIAVTAGCYGEIVLIEVENPKGIGFEGTFSYVGEKEKITYKNAIGVPYFEKTGISADVPRAVGTWLYFEYRELTEKEREQPNLFSPDPPIVCPTIYGPPSVTYYIVTKIITLN